MLQTRFTTSGARNALPNTILYEKVESPVKVDAIEVFKVVVKAIVKNENKRILTEDLNKIVSEHFKCSYSHGANAVNQMFGHEYLWKTIDKSDSWYSLTKKAIELVHHMKKLSNGLPSDSTPKYKLEHLNQIREEIQRLQNRMVDNTQTIIDMEEEGVTEGYHELIKATEELQKQQHALLEQLPVDEARAFLYESREDNE